MRASKAKRLRALIEALADFLEDEEALDGVELRAIDPAARRMDDEAETVRFSLDPEKVLLFSKADESRIHAELA